MWQPWRSYKYLRLITAVIIIFFKFLSIRVWLSMRTKNVFSFKLKCQILRVRHIGAILVTKFDVSSLTLLQLTITRCEGWETLSESHHLNGSTEFEKRIRTISYHIRPSTQTQATFRTNVTTLRHFLKLHLYKFCFLAMYFSKKRLPKIVFQITLSTKSLKTFMCFWIWDPDWWSTRAGETIKYLNPALQLLLNLLQMPWTMNINCPQDFWRWFLPLSSLLSHFYALKLIQKRTLMALKVKRSSSRVFQLEVRPCKSLVGLEFFAKTEFSELTHQYHIIILTIYVII